MSEGYFNRLLHHPTVVQFGHYFYRYFLRYFLDDEVGHFWSILNGMLSTFTIGFLTLYAMKGWGLTAWNRNLVKNKKRFLSIASRRMKEELAKDESPEKNESRKSITTLDFDDLWEKLQKGTITAEQAVDAYRYKALECHERLNCVTDFVKEAVEWAKELDAKCKGKPKPPLFGIPFSVKDNFHMDGYDATTGLAKRVEDPMTDTCSFVSHLRSLGAIPIARTNVPQTMLSFSCSNPVFGATKNPHNPLCSPGGSSGGEACIIATGGCPFGIGSDIGGSLRIPAHFCGVVTLKPSESRLTVLNAEEGAEGCVRLGLGFGFFTKDVKTQIRLWNLTLTEEYFARNAYTIPLPLRLDMTDPQKVVSRLSMDGEIRGRIGYYVDDGFIEAAPACRRAVEIAADVLKESGYELVRFTVPEPWKAYKLATKALFSDNFQSWRDTMNYEDVDDSVLTVYRLSKVPLCVRWFVSKLVGLKWPRAGHVAACYVKNLKDLRVTFAEIKKYRNQFAQHIIDQDLDAIICPAFTFTALSNEWCSKLSSAFFYTALYNLLDMPAGVVPVTRVIEQDLRGGDLAAYPRSVLNGERCDQFSFMRDPFYAMIRQAVDEAGDNLPVGVQVAALPFREETCLRVMAEIERGVQYEYNNDK